MLIETWVAVLIIIFIFILGIVSLIGWILADQRLENATEEIRALQKKNVLLNGKLRTIRLYINLKENEKCVII